MKRVADGVERNGARVFRRVTMVDGVVGGALVGSETEECAGAITRYAARRLPGIDESSSFVYSCCGLAKMSAREPRSTILPRCMTATSLAMVSTTARS